MSHDEYIANLDEDQLASLIEKATTKREAIQQSGWVKLWVVNINWCNVGWFAIDDYDTAIMFAHAKLAECVKHEPRRNMTELVVTAERFRPSEVAELLTPKLG